MDILLSGVVLVVILGAAYGLSFWAQRARTDRSAFVGLYLVFGFPALLLFLYGMISTIFGDDRGPYWLAIGLGLGLPLSKAIRRQFARFTPIDPASPIDMTGMCLFLGVMGFMLFTFAASGDSLVATDPVGSPSEDVATTPDDDDPERESTTTTTEPVTYTYLITSVIAEVGLAYVAVGFLLRRSFRQATARLGLIRPNWKTPLVAVGFVFLGLIVSATASLLTAWLQSDLSEQINRATEDLTRDVQSPLGAIVLGLSAGIGEEVLLRGAIQPRFGLILTSILFALLHSQYGISFVVVGLFGIGMLLGWERQRFGTTAAIATHALFNTLAVLAQVYS